MELVHGTGGPIRGVPLALTPYVVHAQALCGRLESLLPELTAAAHWALIFNTLAAHVGCAILKRWSLPHLRAVDSENRTL